jgi:hypothetical protein
MWNAPMAKHCPPFRSFGAAVGNGKISSRTLHNTGRSKTPRVCVRGLPSMVEWVAWPKGLRRRSREAGTPFARLRCFTPQEQSFSISAPMPEFEAYGISASPKSRLDLDPAVRRCQLVMLYVG